MKTRIITVIKLTFFIILFCLFCNISHAEQMYTQEDIELAKNTNITALETNFNKIFESYGKNKKLNRYTFYINPAKWKRMSPYKKVKLYDECTNYHLAKEYAGGYNVPKVLSQRQIRIRSSIDGTLLAEYNPNNGIILKTGTQELKNLARNIDFTLGYKRQKPDNEFEYEKAYRNLVKSIIDDNTYQYKKLSIPRSYKITIDKYGNITKLELLYSYYIPCVDDYAMDIIRSISPFPEFPKGMNTNNITVHATILTDINDVIKFIEQLEKIETENFITSKTNIHVLAEYI